VDNFIIFWVLLSIVSVILHSVESLSDLFALEFLIIDTIAFVVFTVEYVARLYTAPERPELHALRWKRLTYVRSPGAIIDLLAILPTLIEALVPTGLDLRFLRVFRLVRLLKLTRYTSAAVTLYRVIARERQIIVAAGFVMLLLVVLTASMGYLFEHDAQPDKFENIPQSIYWAVVTLASVGYGDISPVTPMGRTLTVVLALIGIGIFAIPAGLLASAFSDQLRIDRESFKHRLLHAYEGGESAARARELIAAEAERLHLSVEDVVRLTREAKEEFEARQREAHESVRAIVIDPRHHPELAAAQFRMMVSQMQMLVMAAGPDAIRKPLAATHPDRELLLNLLGAIERSPTPGRSAPGEASPSHTGN
jgi:voltage-gated potassium channel Kch